MTWQRARRPEQKEQRRAAILAAAKTLLDGTGLDGAGINAIAREAGLSKANLYRYFESREEVFLHIALEEFELWAKRAERALAPLAGVGEPDTVAPALVTSLLDSARLVSLVGVITQVLERNVSVETVVWYKTEVLATLRRVMNALVVAMPRLDATKARSVLSATYFMAAGIAPAANPPPAVREALERPELAAACIDLRADLTLMVTALLRGV